MAELIMLRLEGQMQSWGEASAWDNRGTASLPTKSGIVGLIGGAMGLPRNSTQLVELARAICIGIRADRQGTIARDFQTVQGMPNIYTAQKKPRPGNTIISSHWYLEDASFLVVIQAKEEWSQRIKKAFDSPRWCAFLGRKNCVPSRPVWDGIHHEYADIGDALCRYPAAPRADEVMAYEMESPIAGGGMLSRPDAVVDERTFERRKVWRGTIRRDEDCT